MFPVKGKFTPGATKTAGVSKFKVYSENSKANGGRGFDHVNANSTRTSGRLMTRSMVTDNTILEAKENVIGTAESGCNHGHLGKAKVVRKALADVTNTRKNSFRSEKPGGSRKPISLRAQTSTTSSGRPPVGKVKAMTTQIVTPSQSSAIASTKTVRTSSNFARSQANEIGQSMRRNPISLRAQTSTTSSGRPPVGNVKAMTTQIVTASQCSAIASSKTVRTSSNIARIQASETVQSMRRNLLPGKKKPWHLGSSGSQGNIKSRGKSPRMIGFSVKTSNLRSTVMKSKAANGLMQRPLKNQNKVVLQGSQKTVKAVARTTLQTYNAQRTFKSRSNCKLNKSLGAISAKRVKVAKSSSSTVAEEVLRVGNSDNCSDSMKPLIADTAHSRNFRRRKSYTSSLLSRSELLGQNIEVKKPEELPNIDDEGNHLEVAEYVDDIYQYYWVVETQSTPLENYMMIQEEITPQMRSILINWLVEVHLKFNLMPETLYLSVALLDRYLSQVSVKKKNLQLVGLTSLLLASKYEDFWHPRVKDLISISAESYTRKQILEMEKDILQKLKFRMNVPTAYVFMLRFLKASQSEKQLEHLAFYLIELCLVDYEALKFRPSLLCASAVYLARCTLKKIPAWNPLLEKHAHYSKLEIRECAETVLRIHKAATSNLLKVTYDKYKQPESDGVTSIKPIHSLP